jgi:hypothetical protein
LTRIVPVASVAAVDAVDGVDTVGETPDRSIERIAASLLFQLKTYPAPHDKQSLQQLKLIIQELALVEQSSGRAFMPELDDIPSDQRCGFAGDRSAIWSWAEPRANRRPRYVLCGQDPLALEVVDIYNLDPQQWPRNVVEGL